MLVRHRVRRRDTVWSSAVEASSPVAVSSAADVSVSSPVTSSLTGTASRTVGSLDTVTSATQLASSPSNTRTSCPPHTRRYPSEPSPPAHSSRTGSAKSERAAQRRLPGGQTTHQPTTCICSAVSPTPIHARLSRSQPACQPHVAIHQVSVCPTLRGADCQRQCQSCPSRLQSLTPDMGIDSFQIGCPG